MKTIRTIITAITEGVIKRFSGTGRASETFANREYFQHYGFTSRPLNGAEGIALQKDNIIYLIASDDRRYRIALQDGEVALYTDEGDYVFFKRGKEIEISSGNKITITAAAKVDINGGSGNLKGVVQGDSVCHFTGLPHGDISTNVNASK